MFIFYLMTCIVNVDNSCMSTIPDSAEKAFKIAQKSRDNAYAPYSKLHVGAAIKFKGVDEVIGGCNVENASYGATICAERTGIGQAVARFGTVEIEFLVLSSDSPSGVIPPCGMCLQVMREFTGSDFPVYLGDKDHIKETAMFSQLYPRNFKSEMLP